MQVPRLAGSTWRNMLGATERSLVPFCAFVKISNNPCFIWAALYISRKRLGCLPMSTEGMVWHVLTVAHVAVPDGPATGTSGEAKVSAWLPAAVRRRPVTVTEHPDAPCGKGMLAKMWAIRVAKCCSCEPWSSSFKGKPRGA